MWSLDYHSWLVLMEMLFDWTICSRATVGAPIHFSKLLIKEGKVIIECKRISINAKVYELSSMSRFVAGKKSYLLAYTVSSPTLYYGLLWIFGVVSVWILLIDVKGLQRSKVNPDTGNMFETGIFSMYPSRDVPVVRLSPNRFIRNFGSSR